MRYCYRVGNSPVKPCRDKIVTETANDQAAPIPYDTGMATRPKKDRAKGPGRPLFVKEWFEFLDKSDEQVATIVGVARETVFRWHTEQDRLTPRKLGQLARAIGIQPEDFWRRPGRRSIDALLKDAPDADHAAVHEFVAKIVRRA